MCGEKIICGQKKTGRGKTEGEPEGKSREREGRPARPIYMVTGRKAEENRTRREERRKGVGGGGVRGSRAPFLQGGPAPVWPPDERKLGGGCVEGKSGAGRRCVGEMEGVLPPVGGPGHPAIKKRLVPVDFSRRDSTGTLYFTLTVYVSLFLLYKLYIVNTSYVPLYGVIGVDVFVSPETYFRSAIRPRLWIWALTVLGIRADTQKSRGFNVYRYMYVYCI